MNKFPALRLGSHCFLLAALLSFFSPFAAAPALLWLTPALCLGADLAAAGLGSLPARLALGLVPALGLLIPASGWAAPAGVGAIAFYNLIALALGRFRLEVWAYRREALWTLLLCLGLGILSFLVGAGGRTSLGLAAGAGVLTLLALGACQVSGSMGPAWEARTGAAVLLTLGLGGVLGLSLWAARPLVVLILRGVGGIFAGLISLVTWLASLIFRGEPERSGGETPTQPSGWLGPPQTGAQGQSAQPPGPGLPGLPQVELPWTGILAVLGLVLVTVLLVRLLRSGAVGRNRSRPTLAANGIETRPGRRRRGAEPAPADNRTQLRELYGQYLRFLRLKGLPPGPGDTTADITQRSSELLVQTDELLRASYRLARYSSREITDEELRRAREALAHLIAEENLRRDRP